MSYIRSIYVDNLKVYRWECVQEFAKEFWFARKFKKFMKEQIKEANFELESMLDLFHMAVSPDAIYKVHMAVTSDAIGKGNGCKSEVMDNDMNEWCSFNPKAYKISTFIRKPKRKVKAPVTVNK